jgi:hypothetical protein
MAATCAPDSTFDSSRELDARTARKEREAIGRELDAMSAAMVEEEGLLNHTQAAILLDVSVKRIGELVRLEKFKRFDFLGRTYVSVREVRERRQQELKAGRPKQSLLKRIGAGIKAAAKTDSAQAKLGGFAGPYERAKARRKNQK